MGEQTDAGDLRDVTNAMLAVCQRHGFRAYQCICDSCDTKQRAFQDAASTTTVIALLDEIAAHEHTAALRAKEYAAQREQLAAANAEIERLRDHLRVSEEQNEASGDANVISVQLAAARAEAESLRKSSEWNAAHAKMMARAADTEKADREVFRLALKDTREQLSTMTAARDEACDIADGLANYIANDNPYASKLDRIVRISTLRKVGPNG